MRLRRLRRLRRSRAIRDWVSETTLKPKDIILPYFAVNGKGVKREIPSMPGVYHLSPDNIVKDIAQNHGIKAVLLFGIPDSKRADAVEAYSRNAALQKTIGAIKKEFGTSKKEIIVMTDVCMCAFTPSGHCGVIKNAGIDNDATLKVLKRIALSHAGLGADFVAPSAMMDNQVASIRRSLDKRGFKDVGILAYSAKYSSNFYSPFRDALDSAPRFGDRKSYQMDYRNSDEALKEIGEDIREGADMVMIKPALSYLDIIRRAKEKFNTPIAAYNVSGEYAMVKKFCAGDKALEKALVLETLTSIKRAGADFIITYFGKGAVKWLAEA